MHDRHDKLKTSITVQTLELVHQMLTEEKSSFTESKHKQSKMKSEYLNEISEYLSFVWEIKCICSIAEVE